MTLAQIEKSRQETKARLKALLEANRQAESDLQAEIDELNRSEKMALDGVDLTKIMLGEHVLSISMCEPLAGEDRAVIADAVADLANGARVMRSEYFCTKNYDRWYHQGCGPVKYGYGPRHGSTVFCIGLCTPHLPKSNKDIPRDLTAEEIDAGIYLLKMLEIGKYQTAKMAAKSA